MREYSHRDRRAQRAVGLAFWTVVALTLGLTGFSLGVPLPLVGFIGVAALGVLGAGAVVWSEVMLASYASDLQAARSPATIDGFVRAEVASPMGSRHDIGTPTARSPHARRVGGSWGNPHDAALRTDEGIDQA
ncbi:MAG TPA: hypothetical protein VK423_05820 [Thermoplasmata archaeon]|nr:hypothetical protein [Thermoplasmata archaeon]